MAVKSRRAAFIDKDGTLLEDVPYNVDPAKMRLVPCAEEALPAMRAAGFEIVIVSNQSGVARGLFEESALAGVEARLRDMLAEVGVPLAAFLYCPHHPDGRDARYAVSCSCRKPAPGMIKRAAREHGFDAGASWRVGDILDDVEAGRRAGCRTVLLDSAHETLWERRPNREPHYVARDFAHAADIITGAYT